MFSLKEWQRWIMVWLWGMVVLITPSSWAAENEGVNDSFCIRCHGMATLAWRDEERGKIVSLHVDGEKMKQSPHGQFACRKCHDAEAFQSWPHTLVLPKSGARSCLACHGENPQFTKYRFERIQEQFSMSVHADKKMGMDCYACHDPHLFTASNIQKPLNLRIEEANQACRQCHVAEPADKTAVRKFMAEHTFLPEKERHFRSVRCVDCHTPRYEEMIHIVEPAERAAKECVSCHTKDSMLLAQLYRYTLLSERNKGGFWNSLVLNEAYVVGMTRNKYLDGFALVLLMGCLFGLGGHGLLRYLAAKKRRNYHE